MGNNEALTLEGVRWGEFFISDVAEIISGYDINDDEKQQGNYPYISSSSMNNGISHFVSNINETLEADCISVCRTGSVGYAFYHPYEALYSNNCRKLRLHHRGKYAALFIANQITSQRERYNYGYIMGTARLMRQKILLPADESGRPDYAFMERFMRNIEQRLIRAYVGQVSVRLRNTPPQKLLSLCGITWGNFFISDVAEIISGRDIYDDERVSGSIPYIGSSALNNGITHFISNTNETQESECISVNRNGSVGYAFYHPYEALYSNDCRKIRPRVKDKYAALFIATQITAQKDKYSYGYKMGTARLMRQKIMLPVTPSGTPDWQLMHSYMLSLETHHLSAVLTHFTAKLHRAYNLPQNSQGEISS